MGVSGNYLAVIKQKKELKFSYTIGKNLITVA
jgi:hypothetical protein